MEELAGGVKMPLKPLAMREEQAEKRVKTAAASRAGRRERVVGRERQTGRDIRSLTDRERGTQFYTYYYSPILYLLLGL